MFASSDRANKFCKSAAKIESDVFLSHGMKDMKKIITYCVETYVTNL